MSSLNGIQDKLLSPLLQEENGKLTTKNNSTSLSVEGWEIPCSHVIFSGLHTDNNFF